METNDLLTIIILVVVAIATGIILSNLNKKEKKVCSEKECNYEMNCLCKAIDCPKCPICKECPSPLNIIQDQPDIQYEEQPEVQYEYQAEEPQEDYYTVEVEDATVLEPIQAYDDVYNKPMYVSVMDTDLKSSCGGFDKTESRQQMLGSPFATNYKPMMN